MAHGNSPNFNYICTKSGKYLVKDEEGKLIEHFFTVGDKVDLHGFYGYFSYDVGAIKSRWNKIDSQDVLQEPYYCCDTDYYGNYIYLTKSTVDNCFRPIEHKHLATKSFMNIVDMNEFLKTLSIDCLKDIKIGNNIYLVIYVNICDDKE